jgi:PAS domain S-box-containing protein
MSNSGNNPALPFTPARIPENEPWRLAELHQLEVLDSESEPEFEAFVNAASVICDTPISLLTLVDTARQWFKANVGLNATHTNRDIAFCSHAILEDQLFEVSDASKDPRFAANPLVLGDPHIVFYAGVPLVLSSGANVGTLCVIDRKPRELNSKQRQLLISLGLAATKMLEARRTRIQERNLAELVRLREEKYHSLIAALHVGLIVQTQTSEINLVNSRACELLGLSEDQLRGKTSLDPDWNVIHEDGQNFPGPEHPVPQAIATGRSVLNVVMGVYRPALKDRAWLLVSAVPQMSQGGIVEEVVCSFIDISAQVQANEALKNADKEKEALLKEVHHRVKNNMQVITSLLRLENRRSKVNATKAVLGEMQNRISAMALLHEALYRAGTFASVDLGSYLKQLATQAFQTQATNSDAVRLELNLGSVQVGIDQAIPCGLLINELISNCLKHGFPVGVTGHVSIDLHPLDAPHQWCLRVCDTGTGLPENFEEKRKGSLGLMLVVDLASQIGGDLTITPNPDKGVAFAVNFLAIKPAPLAMPA